MMAAPSITDEVDYSTVSVALQGSIKEYPKHFDASWSFRDRDMRRLIAFLRSSTSKNSNKELDAVLLRIPPYRLESPFTPVEPSEAMSQKYLWACFLVHSQHVWNR